MADIQNNVLIVTTRYPSNNNSDIPNIDSIISVFIANFGNNWILDTGFWDDGGVWKDDSLWID